LNRMEHFFVDTNTLEPSQSTEHPQTQEENTKEHAKPKRTRKRPRVSKDTEDEEEEEDDDESETEDSATRVSSTRYTELSQDPKFSLPSSSKANPSINFGRDELLVMTSEEFESTVARLAALRPLTPAEKSLIKRQRRLIKNRESAQASRQRKKDYVGELEAKVDSLVVGNARLKEDFASLVMENSSLKK